MKIVPQDQAEVKRDVFTEIEAVRERNRQDYEALAKMTGQTIAEIEADLTAPDPCCDEEEECSYDGCHEEPFRYGLCFEHFAEEEMGRWEDERETRLCILEAMA